MLKKNKVCLTNCFLQNKVKQDEDKNEQLLKSLVFLLHKKWLGTC